MTGTRIGQPRPRPASPRGRRLAIAGLCLLAAVLAGCQSSRPAPVVERASSVPASAAARRAAPPAATPGPVAPAASTRQPASAAPARGSTGVQINAVEADDGVEVRSVDVRPAPVASPAPTAVAGSAEPGPRAGTVPAGSAVRTEPRGYKLPWSEENLARVRGGAARPEGKAADPRPAPERSGADKPTPERAVTDKPASVPPAPPQPSAERLAEVAADRPDFVWPVKGRLIERFEGNSRGIGIAAAEGEPVQAAAAGSVLYAGSGIRGYGQLLIVKHNDSYISVYAHNSRLLVKQGDAVRAGQKIAEVGHTDASRSKLHFEIRRQGTSIDPLSLLPARD